MDNTVPQAKAPYHWVLHSLLVGIALMLPWVESLGSMFFPSGTTRSNGFEMLWEGTAHLLDGNLYFALMQQWVSLVVLVVMVPVNIAQLSLFPMPAYWRWMVLIGLLSHILVLCIAYSPHTLPQWGAGLAFVAYAYHLWLDESGSRG